MNNIPYMTETEKITIRQATLQSAMQSIQTALTADRKFSSEKPSGHWTTALTELKMIEQQLAKIASRFSK